MIRIKSKEECCGCESCIQTCPKMCISLVADKEGFLYPRIDESVCVDCRLCEKVCPMINDYVSSSPIVTFASKNKNEKVRMSSSSGGIFSLFAEKIIEEGGVVFGAVFDEYWQVVLDCTDRKENIDNFRRSKYVQAKTGDSYRKVQFYLKQGRKVLFSGTPCQIIGLKLYLQKEYPNLITVDVACHGVPSPKVWEKYLLYIGKREQCKNRTSYTKICPTIQKINFRGKEISWEQFTITINFVSSEGNSERQEFSHSIVHRDDLYMKLFLKDVILRPSCYHCSMRMRKSMSDIMIADFWAIDDVLPDFNDHKGVSLVVVKSEKGKNFFSAISTDSVFTEYDVAIKNNGGFQEKVVPHPNREFFFNHLDKMDDLSKLVEKTLNPRPAFVQRIKISAFYRVKKLLNGLGIK